MKTRAANWRRLQLWCALAVLTAFSATESFAQPAGKVFNLGGATLSLEEATTDLGVYYTSLRYNRAANVWNVEVSLTNRSSRTWLGPVVLLVESFSGTSGPLQPDGSDEAAKPFYELSSLVLDSVMVPQETSLRRTLSIAFQSGASPQLTTKVFARLPQSLAGLQVVRTLDDAGLPLPSVTVDGASDAVQTDDAFGLATLTPTNQTSFLRFSATGYLPVWRIANVNTGTVGVIPNPRLTRRDANPVSLTPIAGGELTRGNPAVQVRFTPGAFSQDSTAVLTPLTGQTLPLFLPPGWSPLSAFWLELSAEPALPGNGTLTPSGPIQPGETAALVRLNTNSLTWEVLQLVPGNGSNAVNVALPGGGAFALVVADSGLIAPPAPTVGSPLLPSAAPLPVAANLRAGGTVTPSSSPASKIPELVTASAEVIVTNIAGNLPSGTLLRGEVSERYSLRDGTSRFPALFDNFIVGYQRPGDARLDTLRAEFPIRPLLLFGADELEEAVVRMDLFAPDAFSGGILGTNGGQVASEGLRVLAGAGDLLTQQAVQLRRLTVTNFTELAGSNATVMAAFEIGVSGVAAGHKLIVQLSGLATNSTFVLARVLAREGLYGLEPRERLHSDANGNLASDEPLSGDKLPGLNGAGQYVLLKINPAQGLVSGIARNGAGQPVGGLSLRIAGQPWLTFSANDGAFKLLAPAGDATVTINDLATGDSGAQIVNIPNPQTPVNTQLASVSSGPRVLSVSPTNNATAVSRVTPVIITFSKPINPGSLALSGVLLLGASNQPVAASMSLNLNATTVTLLPVNPLDANTLHTIALSTNIADLLGRRLEGQNLFAFTTENDALNRVGGQFIIYEPTNGLAPVSGSPGTADPESPVILVNQTSGKTATILSKPDGSFTNFIEANVEDFISAVLVNQNGTRTTLPASRQIFRDGSVGLFNGGGILEAESDNGPMQVIVEPGSIESKTKFQVQPLNLIQLRNALGVLPTNGAVLLGGFAMAQSGDDLKLAPDVAFPIDPAQLGLPPGVDPTNASFALTVPREMDDGTIGYEIVDQMHYENGKLVTHSPPFLGALLKKLYSYSSSAKKLKLSNQILNALGLPSLQDTILHELFLPMMVAQGTSVVIHGHVRAAKFGPPDADGNPVIIPGSLRVVPGAVVTVINSGVANDRPGRIRPGQTFCTADELGRYTFLVPLDLVTGPAAFDLIASHPAYFPQVAAGSGSLHTMADRLKQALGQLELGIAVDLYFPIIDTSLNPGDDTVGPRIFFAQEPRDPAPGTNAGDGVTIVISASDDREVASIQIQVNDYQPISPNITNFTVPQPENLVQTNLSSTRKQATFGLHSQFRANATIHVTAADSAGNSRDADFPILFAGDRVFPVVSTNTPAPRLLSSWPADGAKGTPLGSPLTLRFSAPLATNSADVANTWLQIQNGQIAAVTLSPNAKQATVFFNGIAGADVTFTILPALLGANNKQFDQQPGTPGNQSRSITIGMAAPDTQQLGMQSGGGAVQVGAYVFALERQGQFDGSVVAFDVSGPTPVRVGEIGVPGFPRDLALIPNYSFRLHPNDTCQTRDLLGVIGGTVGAETFQFLWVIDISDPTHPTRVAGTAATLAAAALTKLKWSPPFLAYLESGADLTSVNLVTLQTFILGMNATPSEIALFPPGGVIGVDTNADGDFCDTGDVLPLPFVSAGNFFGKDFAFAPLTSQRIQDFDFDADTAIVGLVLSKGFKFAQNGSVDTNQPLPAAYVSAFDAFGRIDPAEGTTNLLANENPKRVVILPNVLLLIGTNTPTFRTLAVVSAQVTSGTAHKLIIIDISDTHAPVRLGELSLAGFDIPQSLIRREDGLLALATSTDVLLIDPSRLLLPPTPNGSLPAIVGIIPGAGSGVRSFDAPTDGINVVSAGGKNQIVRTGPSLRLLSFPSRAPFTPQSMVGLDASALSSLMAESVEATTLIAARLFQLNGTNPPTLLPPDPTAHYYVRVDFLGAPGRTTLDLVAESLNDAGVSLPNFSSNSLPARLASTASLQALGVTNVSIFPTDLKAYRLDPNPVSAFHSVYLAGPIALPTMGLTASQFQSVTQQLPRRVLAPGRLLWVGLDPMITGTDAPTNALSRVQNGKLVPGSSDFATVSHTVTPIIFIPGVAGSHLNRVFAVPLVNPSLELWPGLTDFQKDALSLKPGASSAKIVASDILRIVPEPYGLAGFLPDLAICSFPGIYDPFIHFLTHDVGLVEYDYLKLNAPSLRCEDGGPATDAADPDEMADARTVAHFDEAQLDKQPDLFIFPYDWRFGNEATVTNLAEYVKVVKTFHPEADQIDIVAHSMGGLVARRFILDNPGVVRKLITIGSPWLGAPKAINAMETGDFLDAIQHILVISKEKLKELAEYFPGPQQLVPPQAYFNVAGPPFVDDAGDLPGNSSGPVLSYNQFTDLMDDIYHPDPQVHPASLSATFHDYQVAGQGSQDDWQNDNTGVQYFHIAAIQSDANTIGKVISKQRIRPSIDNPNHVYELKHEFTLEYTRGDGTVPVFSSLRIGNGLNLNAPGAKLYKLVATNSSEDKLTDHNGMLANTNLHELVRRILTDDIPEPNVATPASGVVTYVVRFINAEGNEVVASLLSDPSVNSARTPVSHNPANLAQVLFETKEEDVPGLEIEEPATNIVDAVLRGGFELRASYDGRPISLRVEEQLDGVAQTVYVWHSLDPSDFPSNAPSDFEAIVTINSPPVVQVKAGGNAVLLPPDSVGPPDDEPPKIVFTYTNDCTAIQFSVTNEPNAAGVEYFYQPVNPLAPQLATNFFKIDDQGRPGFLEDLEVVAALNGTRRLRIFAQDGSENNNRANPVIVDLVKLESLMVEPSGAPPYPLADIPANPVAATLRSPNRYLRTTDIIRASVRGVTNEPAGYYQLKITSESDTNGETVALVETPPGSGIYLNQDLIEVGSDQLAGVKVKDEELLFFEVIANASGGRLCMKDVMVDAGEFAGAGIQKFYENSDRTTSRNGALAVAGFSDAGDGLFPNFVGALFPTNNPLAEFILNAGSNQSNRRQADILHIATHGNSDGVLSDDLGATIFDPDGAFSPGVEQWNHDVEWIILAGCSALSDEPGRLGLSRWHAALDGFPRPAHGLLGNNFQVSGNLSNQFSLFWERLNAGDSFRQAYELAMTIGGNFPQPWVVSFLAPYRQDSLTNLAADLEVPAFTPFQTERFTTVGPSNVTCGRAEGPLVQPVINLDSIAAPGGTMLPKLELAVPEPLQSLTVPMKRSYVHGDLRVVEFEPPPDPPRETQLSAEDARRIADDFLRTNLPSLFAAASFDSAYTQVNTRTEPSGASLSWTNGFSIHYRIRNAGIPVWGDRVSVSIEQGQVIRVATVFHQVTSTPGSKAAVAVTAQSARATYEKAQPAIAQTLRAGGHADITEAELCYVRTREIDKTATSENEFVLAWRFFVDVSGSQPGTRSVREDYWVNAVTGDLLGHTVR